MVEWHTKYCGMHFHGGDIHAAQGLGMPCEKVTPRIDIPANFLDDRFLCWAIKVNQYISAKYDVEHIADAIVVVHEIEPMKAYFGSQSCRNPDEAV
jgi:hypothetical protein